MRSVYANTLLVLVGSSVPQAAAVKFFEVKVPGAVYTDAYGVNIKNEVVGYYSGTQDQRLHGFLFHGGTYTTLDYPGRTRKTFAQGINDSSEIVGFFQAADFTIHAFLDQNGVFTQLDFPGGLNTIAHAINNAGDIVGIYDDASHKQHGFLYQGGTWTALDVPGAGVTVPYGINNLGDVVGIVENGLSTHGFLLDHTGQLTKIDFPGSKQATTAAYGINDAGQIVGTYEDPAINKVEGYSLSQGRFTNVRYPGASTTFPQGISNTPVAVGKWFDSLGNTSGFAAR
jgi:probable HAF family extracellular repeat protein